MAEATAEDRAIAGFMAQMSGPEEQTQQPAAPVEPQADVAEAQPEAQAEPKAEQQEPQDVQTIEIDPEEPLFEQEVEVEGQKSVQKLSLKELQQSYLTAADIRKAKMDLARQKDEIPKIVSRQVNEVRDSAVTRVTELQNMVLKTVAKELGNVDFGQLAKEDPWKYAELVERRNELHQLLQTVQKEVADDKAKRAEEEQQRDAEKWAKSLEILTGENGIKDFGPAVVKRLIDAAEDWGFAKDEVAKWNDHRYIKMLHALSEKKSVETKRPEVEKKVAVVTKTLKPGQATQPKSQLAEAKAKLRKTGKPEDALAIFEAYVG